MYIKGIMRICNINDKAKGNECLQQDWLRLVRVIPPKYTLPFLWLTIMRDSFLFMMLAKGRALTVKGNNRNYIKQTLKCSWNRNPANSLGTWNLNCRSCTAQHWHVLYMYLYYEYANLNGLHLHCLWFSSLMVHASENISENNQQTKPCTWHRGNKSKLQWVRQS